jgi:uncharacterized protein (TIGR02145 family)
MKRILASIGFLFAFAILAVSQVPQKVAYQALVRNANGQAITNQEVSVRISLLVGSMAGEAVYTETHNVTSTPIGIINLTIGEGSLPSGSMLEVPWSEGIFIKLEIDPTGGTSYVEMGTSQVVSVPYALQAGGLAIGAIEVKPAPGHDPDAPIFVVRNSNNEIVFVVYESGARVYIDDTGKAKSARGGFAIGGLADQTKGAKETNYLTILPDSVRFNIQQPAKGKNTRGGFAIGGLADQTKEVTMDYLTLRADSIRFAIDESLLDKNNRGGFAIGGLADQTKAFTNYFMVNRDCTYVMNTLTAAGNVIVAGDMMTGGIIGTLPATDLDGNTYTTASLGGNIWMAENLRTTKYSDGTEITSPIFSGGPAYFQVLDDGGGPQDPSYWGYLYALKVIDPLRVCPLGWRLPTAEDWQNLISSTGALSNAITLVDMDAGWTGGVKNTSGSFNARPTGVLYKTLLPPTQNNSGFGNNTSFWTLPFPDPQSGGLMASYVYQIYQYSYDFFEVSSFQQVFIPAEDSYNGYAIRCVKASASALPTKQK